MIDDSNTTIVVFVVLGYVVLAIALVVTIVSRYVLSGRFRGSERELADTKKSLRETSQSLSEVCALRQGLQLSLQNALERTADLEEQLAHAGQRAERLSAAVKRLETQNTQIYDEHKKAGKEHSARGIELDYWHHFANLVLHDSRSRLGKVGSFLENVSANTAPDEFDAALQTITFVTDLLELGEVRDITRRVREIRAKAGAREFNALPRLRRFVEESAKQLGARFESKLPSKGESLLFNGSWAHIELLLANVFENARKHSIEGSPISFECDLVDYQCRFLMTNYSPRPVSEAVRSAKDEMKAGDPTRPRFGLFLMEAIAAGYSGFVRIDNLRSVDDPGYRIRTEIKLPTDG